MRTQNLLDDYLNYLDGEELLKPFATSIGERFYECNLNVFHTII
jgi:hypothetical protein